MANINTLFYPGDIIVVWLGATAEERKTAKIVSWIYDNYFDVEYQDGSTGQLELSKNTEKLNR